MLQFEKLHKLDSILDQKTLLGYFPCLTEKFGQVVESPPLDYLDDFERDQGNVQSVGWVEQDSGEVVPVLFVNNAKDVFTHLTNWVNGDTTWFTFIWEVRDGFYSMALIPDVRRVIKNSGLQSTRDTNIFQWVWSFNSENKNYKVKDYLKARGQQKVIFADVKDEKIYKTFSFPVFKQSEISVMNPLINQSWTHLFKN